MYSAATVGAIAEQEALKENYWVAQLDFFEPVVLEGSGLVKSVEESEDEDEESDDEAEPIIQFRVDLIPTASPSKCFVLEFMACRFTEISLTLLSSQDPPAAEISSSLGANGILAMASMWMKNCCNFHALCNRNSQPTIPTRLVSTFENQPRLHLSTDFQNCPKYATLSHCWGKGHFLTLKKDNIRQFKEGIPKAALSKTFKDAIHVAKELGIPYIWIDCICIVWLLTVSQSMFLKAYIEDDTVKESNTDLFIQVQDDAKDWECEASLMSTVYGNSTLNIAAAWARDGSQGLFCPRPVSRALSKILARPNANPTIYDCAPSELYRRSMTAMPLEFRGWTLQERVLPSKSLYFTQTQVFWECHQSVACETFPLGFPRSLMYHESSFRKVPVSRALWTWIVQDYSARDLTFASDKLVAISGLARKIWSLNGDQYYAGLWRQGFELQLLWSRAHWDTGPRDGEREAFAYRAPSWSWACLDHPTDCRDFLEGDKRAFFIEVLDIQVALTGSDPFGQVSAATLRLCCQYLLPGTVEMDKECSFGKVWNGQSPVDVYLDHPDKHVPGRGGGVYFLPVTRLFSAGYLRLEGLILQSIDEVGANVYQRVGKFSISNEHDCGRFMETALSCENSQKTHTVNSNIEII